MPSHRRNLASTVAAIGSLLLATVPVHALAAAHRADYDGDGASDLFWRETSSGANVVWRSGDRALPQAVMGVRDPAWRVVGQGDFDGDGRSDLLWRHRTSGRNVIWASADFNRQLPVAAVTDLRWTVAGIGDFDGDGRADIFWRNQVTGANVIWRSAASTAALAVATVPDRTWILAGIGDFDGDGASDIAWRNTANGLDVVWLRADVGRPQAVASVTDQAWVIAGVGDFDGDGRADLFWRNTRYGADTIWKSANVSAQQPVTGVTNQDWQVAAIGDYDADGKADVFWRDTRSGADAIWLSANAATTRATSAVTNQAWVPFPHEGQAPGVVDPRYTASAPSPFAAGCDGAATTGTLYANAEVEPTFAISPLNSLVAIAAWQQDRWSDGSARGIVAAYSNDGGVTWARRAMPMSRCGGGNTGNGGDYARATDPWLTISPNGAAFLMALSSTGGLFASGSSNAMLVSRSLDGGRSWSTPITLIRDGANAFNDKNSITADPTNASLAYAVWDRLTPDGNGPVYFTRTTDGGTSWEPARPIYDPGGINQTIGNLVVVLHDGSLLDLFTQINPGVGGSNSAFLAVIRSVDKGRTWSAPIRIADDLAIGARDPQTGAEVRDSAAVAQIAVAPDGMLYVVWQDARFSGGAVDGIALSRSADGGQHWTAPVRINRAGNVAAFVPSVHVRGDGSVGVSYFDFRSDTASTASLLTDYWLACSDDGGATWRESRVSPAFDLDMAPNAEGLFLGDYQALGSRGALFVPFFAKANDASSNRTDIFAAPAVSIASDAAAFRATPAPAPATAVLAPQFQQRVQANLERIIREHLPPPRAEARKQAAPP